MKRLNEMKFEKLTDFLDAFVETLGILALVAFASVAGFLTVHWAFGLIAKLLAD